MRVYILAIALGVALLVCHGAESQTPDRCAIRGTVLGEGASCEAVGEQSGVLPACLVGMDEDSGGRFDQ